MNDTNEQKNHLAYNLATLRKQQRLTLEQVAERIGVTRQAVAKWETGESMPDLINCDALATLYNVSLDDLVHFDQEATGIGVPPKDKHLFGTVQIGERGQIVIPKKRGSCWATNLAICSLFSAIQHRERVDWR